MSRLRTLCAALMLALLATFAGAAPFAYIHSGQAGISVIDVASHQVVAVIPAAGARAVHTTPGWNRAYAAGPFFHVIDTSSQTEIDRWPVGGIELFAVSPSSPRIYAVLENAFGEPVIRVRVLSALDGETVNSFELQGGAVGDIAFTNNGQYVLVINFWGWVHMLDAATGTEVGRIPITGFPEQLAMHPAGDLVYVPQLGADAVAVMDLRSRSVVASIPVGEGPRHAVVDPSGTRAYVSNHMGSSLSVIDTASNRVVGTAAVCAFPWAVDVTPDGRFVYVVCPDSVEVISTATLARVTVIPLASPRASGKFIGGPSDAPSTPAGPATGLWWNPNEPGWGVHITQRRSTFFAALFHYDAAGAPKWLVAPNCAMNSPCPGCINNVICNGAIFETNGPAFFHAPFNPASVQTREVGLMELRFTDRDRGHLTYIVSGQHRSLPIERQQFAPRSTLSTDYTDLWWNPLESGWGLGITQQDGVMFLTWFVYDEAGRPAWYVASNCGVIAAGNGCRGVLYRTSGPLGPVPGSAGFDRSALRVAEVGTIDVSFEGADNGVITYTVDGRTGTKAITRQLF